MFIICTFFFFSLLACRKFPSDSISLSSSEYSSFRSQTGPEETPTLPMKKASSVDFIPPKSKQTFQTKCLNVTPKKTIFVNKLFLV